MDYKEKYEQGLECIQEILSSGQEKIKMTLLKERLLPFFPELGESEDERIRKGLIKALGTIGKRNWGGINVFESIAWLEKQGEQKLNGTFVNVNDVREDFIQEVYRVLDADSTNDRANQIIDAFDNLPTVVYSNQCEQTSAEKVEPKFKAGDYVVIDGEVLHVKEVTEDGYLTDEGGLIPFRNEKEARLWTIQDVKDGDVLSFNDGHGNDCIELIKSITDLNKDKKIEFWFCLTNNEICEVFDGVCPYTNMTSRQNAKPATKEQRDTLMKAMADAGYTFDFDKKELKKIEQKPAWSEEDEWCLEQINFLIRNSYSVDDKVERLSNWLKSLKDRYAFKPSEEQITVCKEVYADLLSAKGFDLGTVNSELNRLEEKFKETKRIKL